MRLAAKELKEAGTEDCVVDRAVSVDGTWQRRGHASQHDVVTALSNEPGKCLAVEVLSNICKGSVVKLFQCLGIEGNYNLRARKAKDTERIAKSTYKSLEHSNQRKKTLRAIKKGFQAKAEATERDIYPTGGH
ncbi:hypothetical protein RRG08_039920 [Elysia crispata]|uniref:Uncharacterized protein n=1 Tax=Elysia crispata TaxID=231223 RepID=A0AAE0ZNW7_9GAST|nr:hypothetical protein RRG08_039920 [Elysia crispata]